MPEIKLEHINKRWNKFYAVDDLNLTIENNAFVTLLGPSGCGKTTTLRMIAGLETPTDGKITIGDRVVFDSKMGINVPPNKRKVGFLFQNYALWPNMTVYQNISFGLTNIKEELPKIDFEALNNARLAEILSKPADVVKVLEECRDKKGNIDRNRAVLKLIECISEPVYSIKSVCLYLAEQIARCDDHGHGLLIALDICRDLKALGDLDHIIFDCKVLCKSRERDTRHDRAVAVTDLLAV